MSTFREVSEPEGILQDVISRDLFELPPGQLFRWVPRLIAVP